MLILSVGLTGELTRDVCLRMNGLAARVAEAEEMAGVNKMD